MVRILTDSAADFSEELARQLNVEVLPLGVTFEDGMAYRDRVDLQPEEFYEKLAACEKLPKTSQPNLGDVLTAFENARDAGDEMVAIFISSQLSGTYQSACMAADTVEYPGIHVVDSLNAAMGQHLLVRLAVRLRDEGFSATQIAARLDREKYRVCQLAIVDSLKYLHKGGRLSGAVAVAGGLLGIKPVICLEDGKVKLAGKLFRKICGRVGQNTHHNRVLLFFGQSMPLLAAFPGRAHTAFDCNRLSSASTAAKTETEPSLYKTIIRYYKSISGPCQERRPVSPGPCGAPERAALPAGTARR